VTIRTVVRVEGFRELDKALGQLPESTARNTLRRVLKKAAEPIHIQAKSLAPVRDASDPDVYYGPADNRRLRLRGTTKFLVQSGTRLTKRQARAVRKAGKYFAEHYVGTRDRVAQLVEYGTSESRAQPFMRPAWDANKMKALEIIKSELGEEIQKSATRLARKRAKAGL
jgi:HK97 gp10 family phage protein